jgi:hypothetical protein
MKARFNKTTWRAVSGIAASFLLVVSFQNCGKAGFDSELDGDLDLSSDAALTAKYGTSTAEKVANIPFAFEAALDTITYNSCADQKLAGSDAYFSLKAGAYNTGGIKIKSDFFDYVDQNFSPIYPATTLSAVQYKELLQDSPANKGMTPNLALRVKNSLTDVYTKGNLTLNIDIIPMVGVLSDALVSDSIINKNVTATYFPFSPEMRIMEGSLTWNDNETQAAKFRGFMTNSATLALTYTPPNQDIYKVAAANTTYPVKTPYGKGYSMGFSAYAGSTSVSAVQRLMSSVMESDLASPTTSGKAWTCGRYYKVVREADSTVVNSQSYCPSHTNEELNPPSSATQAVKDVAVRRRAELEIVRRHLRSDQWDVNVDRQCVVPKSGVSCYNETKPTSAPTVQYDVTQECYPASPNAVSQCMHYISICTRN